METSKDLFADIKDEKDQKKAFDKGIQFFDMKSDFASLGYECSVADYINSFLYEFGSYSLEHFDKSIKDYVGELSLYKKCVDYYSYFINGSFTAKMFTQKAKSLGISISDCLFIINNYYLSIKRENTFVVHQEKEKFIYSIFIAFLDNEISYPDFMECLSGVKSDNWVDVDKSSLGVLINKFLKEYKEYAKRIYLVKDLESFIGNKEFYTVLFDKYLSLINGEMTYEEYDAWIEKTGIPYNEVRTLIISAAKGIKNLSKEDLMKMEEGFVYNIFMDFYDNKIPFYTLWKTIYSFRTGFNGATYSFHESFVKNFNIYAKKKRGVEDLSMYTLDKPLVKRCHDAYFNALANGISVDSSEEADVLFKEGIDKNAYHIFAKDYALNVNKMSANDFSLLNLNTNKQFRVLSEIEKENNPKKIYDILTQYADYKNNPIEEGARILYVLKGSVNRYLTNKYGPHDLFTKRSELLSKKILDVIRKNNESRVEASKKKQEEEKLSSFEKKKDSAIGLVCAFLDNYDGVSIERFASKMNINERKFNEALNIIKYLEPTLYERYEKTYEERKKTRYTYLMGETNKIINFIMNGINDNGTVREFDALDYFYNTKVKPDLFINLVLYRKKKDEIDAMRKFFGKYAGMSTVNIGPIKKELFFHRGRVMSSFEKDEIIRDLKKDKIPVNPVTFELVLKRQTQQDKEWNEGFTL